MSVKKNLLDLFTVLPQTTCQKLVQEFIQKGSAMKWSHIFLLIFFSPLTIPAQETNQGLVLPEYHISALSRKNTLAHYVSQPNHRVVHGWGQGIYRWKSDATPYFQALETKPLILSGYIALDKVLTNPGKQLQQIKTFSDGWKDPQTNQMYHFIPLLGINLEIGTIAKRSSLIKSALVTELGLQEMEEDQIKNPLILINKLAHQPSEWSYFLDRLEKRGYLIDDLRELAELIRQDKQEAQKRLKNLKNQVQKKVRDQLREKGYPFVDLRIIKGHYDDEIRYLGKAIAKAPGPVLVRFLFETINGIHETLLYSPETFKQAWIHFFRLLHESGATNVERVFHANEGRFEILDQWYPGNDYVDWIGGSLFDQNRDLKACRLAADYAQKKGKPFAICESAPTGEPFRPQGTSAPRVWEYWFEPYFSFIRSHQNVKLFVYINVDWGNQRGEFSHWGNTRIQSNKQVFKSYKKELENPIYRHAIELY